MDFITAIPHYAIWAILVLTVLIFVHEMGHYLAARRCGVRVEVFSIGFGPEIYGWTDRRGTRWKISAVPVGGYVKMFGERLVEETASGETTSLNATDRAVAFGAKQLRQRTFIVFAGPFANYLYAIVVMAGLFAILGQPYTPADVGEVDPKSAAERAGMLPGDMIVAIGTTRVDRFEEVQRIVQRRPGESLRITVMRDGREVVLTATPDTVEFTNRFGSMQREGRLGVRRTTLDRKFVRHDPATALWEATKETASITGKIFEALWQMVTGSRSVRELGGPLKIMQMSGDTAREGIVTWIMFTVILSINLGLFNLFPIPLLDGGHLLFYFFEALRGRPLDERTQEYGFRIGIALILCFALFLTWNDLMSFDVVALFSDS
jgi:regulator of sigma E protease